MAEFYNQKCVTCDNDMFAVDRRNCKCKRCKALPRIKLKIKEKVHKVVVVDKSFLRYIRKRIKPKNFKLYLRLKRQFYARIKRDRQP